MLTTSVAVVRKMLDAVAGSAPSRFSASGTAAPATPDTAQLPAIAKGGSVDDALKAINDQAAQQMQ